MTAYELRLHLRREHDMQLAGLRYDQLLAIHDDDHRAESGHQHDDGPGTAAWARECDEFGCDE